MEGNPAEVDALSGAAIGTVVAGLGSLVWPGLLAAASCLAVLATFVAWIRALGLYRGRRVTGYDPRHLAPLLILGSGGWAGALLLGSVSASARSLALGAVVVGLWIGLRYTGAGF